MTAKDVLKDVEHQDDPKVAPSKGDADTFNLSLSRRLRLRTTEEFLQTQRQRLVGTVDHEQFLPGTSSAQQ